MKSRVGSAGTSLLYVIRLKEDGDVGDEQRNGTIGGKPTDAYRDWVDCTIRCTVHSGDHFLSDYIKNYGNKDGAKGNARASFLELRQQAYNTTNIE